MKYTNRADLLIAAGESIKMQEKAGIEPVCKRSINNRIMEPIIACSFKDPTFDYEFPLTVLEGKPVFVGDELYNLLTGNKFTVHELYTSCFDHASWNPPKPKTVMVELLREDAEFVSSAYKTDEPIPFKGRMGCVAEACRKALETK